MKQNIKRLIIVLLFGGLVSIANAREVRVIIDDWNIGYPPNNEVSIIIHDIEEVGLSIKMVFWRGKLP
ncbi:hypothetical protein MNBD_BACTEROID05-171, partial [hydrothermal vent metagenome]